MISGRDKKTAIEKLEQLDPLDDFFSKVHNPDGSLNGGVNEYPTADAVFDLSCLNGRLSIETDHTHA